MLFTRPKLATYETYLDAEQAHFFWNLMVQAGVNGELVTPKEYFDPVLATSNADFHHVISIAPADFAKADAVVYDALVAVGIEEAHFFNKLDNEALYDVLREADRWSKHDYYAALLVLKNRGIEVTQDGVEAYRANRFEELHKSQAVRPWVKLVFVAMAVSGVWFWGFGLLPACAGWFFRRFTITDFNGNSQYQFNDESRSFGAILLIGSPVVVLLSLIYQYLASQ